MEFLVKLDGGVDLVPAVVVDLHVEVEIDGPELLFVVRVSCPQPCLRTVLCSG